MQTEVLRTSNNWTRFMQLSNEARTRNRGLSGGAKVPHPGAANRLHRQVAVAEKPTVARSQAAVDNRIYASSPPAPSMKILGSRFDAYA
jgi:hypothetical protein